MTLKALRREGKERNPERNEGKQMEIEVSRGDKER